MKKTLYMLTVAAVAAFGTVSASAAASATIEQAKTQCVVGEQADGYLGIVDDAAADQELTREVRDINQQRKAAYAQLARRNGVTIEVTAKLAAIQLIERAPSGHCVRDEEGDWLRKP